ncbi:MAG TPA: DnaB-like helicase C-terminal domain-containing protein, partial [Paenisporosarcina sp.]|nr:DnaB-like helicase C-terminal domain-containing protein [Paenisporosarcina sp.]
GFQEEELIIIGARPSVGKTAFALNVANNAAQMRTNAKGEHELGDVAAIFSLEMPRKQLLKRFIGFKGNIDGTSMRNARKNFKDGDWQSVTMAIGNLQNVDIKIFDKSGVDVNYIWGKVRKLKRQFEGRRILVIIDYLQLIQGGAEHKGNRMQEISEISRMLKHMARELKVSVIALSQLSRGVEQRQDKRPMLSDLRESGQIEQDADVIGFLYRDDYYDKESEATNIIEVILAKQRNGPIGTVNLAFVKEYQKFINIDWNGRQ